ncbi:MAG: hypothetical protein IKO94_01280 [Selenomonadaceae bacterium]|nr:hypothetical protein [Selenomonadaceae bacterium]
MQGHGFDELDMIVTGYGERGICTRIYWSDGSMEEAPVKVATMLKRIAAAYGKTPKSVRHHWRQAHAIPGDGRFGRMAVLPISPGVMLMPVKLPEKMVGRDASIGYVNLAQPIQILEEKAGSGARSRILFRNSSHGLATVWTCRTLRKHWAEARRFWLEEEQRHALERARMERANVYLNWYEN